MARDNSSERLPDWVEAHFKARAKVALSPEVRKERWDRSLDKRHGPGPSVWLLREDGDRGEGAGEDRKERLLDLACGIAHYAPLLLDGSDLDDIERGRGGPGVGDLEGGEADAEPDPRAFPKRLFEDYYKRATAELHTRRNTVTRHLVVWLLREKAKLTKEAVGLALVCLGLARHPSLPSSKGDYVSNLELRKKVERPVENSLEFLADRSGLAARSVERMAWQVWYHRNPPERDLDLMASDRRYEALMPSLRPRFLEAVRDDPGLLPEGVTEGEAIEALKPPEDLCGSAGEIAERGRHLEEVRRKVYERLVRRVQAVDAVEVVLRAGGSIVVPVWVGAIVPVNDCDPELLQRAVCEYLDSEPALPGEALVGASPPGDNRERTESPPDRVGGERVEGQFADLIDRVFRLDGEDVQVVFRDGTVIHVRSPR